MSTTSLCLFLEEICNYLQGQDLCPQCLGQQDFDNPQKLKNRLVTILEELGINIAFF